MYSKAKHPATPGLVMEVTEDRQTELNSYAFGSSDGSDATPILSQETLIVWRFPYSWAGGGDR